MTDDHQEDRRISVHTPVLLHDVIDVLAIAPSDVVLDGTLGGGGHAEALLALLGPKGVYLGIDQDSLALDRVRERLGTDTRLRLLLGNFRDMQALAKGAGYAQVDKILLDLGLSSDQLESHGAPGRGFSFERDEPLAMTFVHAPGEDTLTAAHVVNEWSEESLADVIFGFGEERRARKVARAIVEARSERPLETSRELARVVEDALGRRGRTHPATKTFQAIRMAVNDELGALQDGLKAANQLLAPNGRCAVITFHSLEDRIVKHEFRNWQEQGIGQVITKRPRTPSRAEQKENRRARSAKLRCFVKS